MTTNANAKLFNPDKNWSMMLLPARREELKEKEPRILRFDPFSLIVLTWL